MKEYRVSLRTPNKRFCLPYNERKVRILEYHKNMMRVQYYYDYNHGIDIPVKNGDQMPLYMNESSGSKTLTFTDDDWTYVKENHMLSRERVTLFTQVSSDPKVKLPVDFCFKGAPQSSSK